MSSNSTTSEPSVPETTLLLVGPVFLGAVTSWLIFGISIVQLYIYYLWFPKDHIYIKLLVYWVFILDIFLTVVAASMGWHVLCAGWGRETNLIEPGWTFSAIGCGDGIIATTVQWFYAWRIWRIKLWRVIPGLIVCISLAQLIATQIIAAGIANLQSIAELLPFFPKTTVWLGGGACADLLIAGSMVYILTSAKKNSHAIKQDDRAINRLIRLSIETGSITAALAIIELGFFLGPATKTTNIHLFFALILGKVYSNTMMTSLNSRFLNQNRAFNSAASSRGTHSGGTSSGSGHIGPTRTFGGTPFGTGAASTIGSVTSRPAPAVIHVASRTEVFGDRNAYRDPLDAGKDESIAEEVELDSVKIKRTSDDDDLRGYGQV